MTDLSPPEVGALVARARALKAGAPPTLLTGKTLVLLFERPSLRTRVCLEVAMSHLGGHSTTLQQAEVGLGVRETIADVARSLSRWVPDGGIACRTGAHSRPRGTGPPRLGPRHQRPSPTTSTPPRRWPTS